MTEPTTESRLAKLERQIKGMRIALVAVLLVAVVALLTGQAKTDGEKNGIEAQQYFHWVSRVHQP